jgi:hypothetical protein
MGQQRPARSLNAWLNPSKLTVITDVSDKFFSNK